MRRLTFDSSKREQMIDITADIEEAVRDWRCTAVLLYVLHTTAGILINANADQDVTRDILLGLGQMVPESDLYRHETGNSPAHLKAALIGTSQLVPLEDGRLTLGTFQSIYLAEFDGPRSRTVLLAPITA